MKKSDINILIVEDDKTMRESLLELVKRKGYKAMAAAKPAEAESLVKIKPVHGLIVDVMLPGMNGVDLVASLKENLMDGAGIIFISGIYKDRAFTAEAVRRVEALEYFIKPFDNEQVMRCLQKKLDEYIEAPKVDLHTLLSSPFASNRERRKALDHVEEMHGFDLPFIFCILMDAASSGYLNIVDENQNIFGVTFANGALAKVDSENTALFTKKLLLEHGFITEQELGEVKSKSNSSSSELTSNLVDEGLMSPHAAGIIKLKAISGELKKLISDRKLKINFVPDRKIEPEPDNIDLQGITPTLHDMIDKQIPLKWLKNFYSGWLGHPIRLGPKFTDCQLLLGLPLMSRVSGIIEILKKEPTIEEILEQMPQVEEENIYKALHLLMLKRILVFEEIRRVKNVDEHISRLKSIHAELHDKNPIEVFKFFGLGDNPKTAEVQKVYKDFAKSHHPDTLPKAVSDDVRALNHELFSNVTAAFEILSNPEKKEKFITGIKQREVELQIKSDELVTAAAIGLNRGKYVEALSILEAALNLYKGERCLLHYWWAKFKVQGAVSGDEIMDIEKKLKAMPPEVRQTALWIFVSGLIKRHFEDYDGAESDFKRVLSMEANFMDARRELTAIKSKKPVQLTTEELLTGNLSDVVKNMFKKKKTGS